MIPKQLIGYINSGKCLALVGSGPSTPLGYPSWLSLAEHTVNLVSTNSPAKFDAKLYKALLKSKDYPEVFQYAVRDLGGLDTFAPLISPLFRPRTDVGQAYQYLSRWPFRCYLTTNYDDELTRHLEREDTYYTTIRNSLPELAQLTAQSCGLVVKLHSDFTDLNGLVLTRSQYADFKISGPRQYFRTVLMRVFSMLPTVVVGHSMSDPDLLLVLELAREAASPELPVYMIVADAAPHDVRKYREQYNIELLTYPNPDRSHSNLLYLLRQIDRFVIPRRQSPRPPVDPPDAAMSETGAALYVYSALTIKSDGSLLTRVVEPQVLAAVASEPDRWFTEAELISHLQPPNVRADSAIPSEVGLAVRSLESEKLLESGPKGIRATKAGFDKLAEISTARRLDEDHVVGALRSRLQKVAPPKECEKLIGAFRTALMTVLRRRGLATAEMLFRNNSFEPPDMPELFESVFPAAAITANYEARSEYCDFVMALFTSPTEIQRRFLSNMAQGFFAYHMFGHDPSGTEVRRRLAQDTVWLCDSNVLLPLLAEGCHSHGFMVDLLERMRTLGIEPTTTRTFVKEVMRGFHWAVSQVRVKDAGSEHDAVLRLLSAHEYRENLFIDGYVRGHAANQWPCFADYVDHLNLNSEMDATSRIECHGVRVVSFEGLPRVVSADIEEENRLSAEILSKRRSIGTARGGKLQSDAEAEALQMLRLYRDGRLTDDGKTKRAYFVSTSRLLDTMYKHSDGLITWLPETLYKHLQYLTADRVDPQRMFEAIASSFYAVGVNVLDEDAYRTVFKPAIGESKIIFEREKTAYLEAQRESVDSEQKTVDSLEKEFKRVPELQKPLFVSRMGWYVARTAERKAQAAEEARRQAETEAEAVRRRAEEEAMEARRRAEQIQEETRKEAKRQIDAIKEEYERRDRERRKHDSGREKNLNDPKHLRKRKRQAKKRGK